MANKLGSLIVNGGVNSRAMQQLVVRGKALAKQRASKINQDLLFANSSDTEDTWYDIITFSSTGFYWNTAYGGNSNGYTYFYLGIA